MKKRFRVLRLFVITLKIFAFLAPAGFIYRWFSTREQIAQMYVALSQFNGQMNQLNDQLVQLNSLYASLGLPQAPVNTTRLSTALPDFVELDIRAVLGALFVGFVLWAVADYLQARVATEENTRATTLLLWRLVQHQVPSEVPDYMKSIHGVWADAPSPQIPDEKWRRVPVTDEMKTVDLDGKNRVFRRPAERK